MLGLLGAHCMSGLCAPAHAMMHLSVCKAGGHAWGQTFCHLDRSPAASAIC